MPTFFGDETISKLKNLRNDCLNTLFYSFLDLGEDMGSLSVSVAGFFD